MKKKSVVCIITAIIVAVAMIPSTAFAGGATLTTNFTNTNVAYANQTVARSPLSVTVTDGTAPYTYICQSQYYPKPTHRR